MPAPPSEPPDDAGGTFRPVEGTDARMHGTTALIICGRPAAEHARWKSLLAGQSLEHIPVIFAGARHAPLTLGQVAQQEAGCGAGEDSSLRLAAVMSGLTGAEMNRLMAGYREHAMPQQIWAAVTPVSESWTLEDLLNELGREREALRDAMQQTKKDGETGQRD